MILETIGYYFLIYVLTGIYFMTLIIAYSYYKMGAKEFKQSFRDEGLVYFCAVCMVIIFGWPLSVPSLIYFSFKDD